MCVFLIDRAYIAFIVRDASPLPSFHLFQKNLAHLHAAFYDARPTMATHHRYTPTRVYDLERARPDLNLNFLKRNTIVRPASHSSNPRHKPRPLGGQF